MANTYSLIASSTVGSGGASYIEFTSIPSTFTDLVLMCSTRHNTSGTVANYVDISLNGSTTSLTGIILLGTGTAAPSTTGQYAGLDSGAGATANTFSNNSYYFPNYRSSNYKSWSVDYVAENNATEAYNGFTASLWSNTSAITSIRLTPQTGTLVQYSTAYLYGINKN